MDLDKLGINLEFGNSIRFGQKDEEDEETKEKEENETKEETQYDSLAKHIKNGCLSGIPPKLGTNSSENFHKHANKFIKAMGLTSVTPEYMEAEVFIKVMEAEMERKYHNDDN